MSCRHRLVHGRAEQVLVVVFDGTIRHLRHNFRHILRHAFSHYRLDRQDGRNVV